MLCFQVTETVTRGILICRRPMPHIPQRELPIAPLLDSACVEAIRQGADGQFYLERASPEQGKEGLLLRNRRDDARKALVRIETMAGVGGKVRLTANVYREMEKRRGPKEIIRLYEPTAPLGVHFYTEGVNEEEYRMGLFEGVDALDVLVSMCPGASLHIGRTGDLRDNNSPWHGLQHMFLQWGGGELRLLPNKTRPQSASSSPQAYA